MASKDSVKGGIQELIQVVRAGNIIAEDNYLDRAVPDRALFNMSNVLVDINTGIQQMATSMVADHMKSLETATETAKHQEGMLSAIRDLCKPSKVGTGKAGVGGNDKKGGIFAGIGKAFTSAGGALKNTGLGLLAMGAAIFITAKAFGEFASVKWEDMAKGLITIGALSLAVRGMKGGKDAWKPLAALGVALLATVFAFQQFADIDWGTMGKGLLVLGALSLAVRLMGSAKAGGTLLALGVALLATTYAFEKFAALSWEDMAKGILAIGALALACFVIGKGAGALVLGVLAVAVIAIAYAFEKFAALDWEGIGKGLLAIAGLAAITLILGAFAPVAIAGGIALGIVSAAMYVLSLAFEKVAESMATFNTGLERMAAVKAADLAATAGAIGLLGISMAAFGVGSAAAGLGNLVTGLLSIGQDSPVEQILKLSQAGDGLNKTAISLNALADAMIKFSTIDKSALSAINDMPWKSMALYLAAGGKINITPQGADTSGKSTPTPINNGPASALPGATAENSAAKGETMMAKAEAAVSQGVAVINNAGKTVVTNATTAIVSAKTTASDALDRWARGGYSMPWD